MTDFETVNESGWIPVEERLPETNKEVLVCSEYSSMYTAKLEGVVDGEVRWTCHGRSNPQPIAWMPLPQPYVNENNMLLKLLDALEKNVAEHGCAINDVLYDYDKENCHGCTRDCNVCKYASLEQIKKIKRRSIKGETQ